LLCVFVLLCLLRFALFALFASLCFALFVLLCFALFFALFCFAASRMHGIVWDLGVHKAQPLCPSARPWGHNDQPARP
jgi:hypothetical protein